MERPFYYGFRSTLVRAAVGPEYRSQRIAGLVGGIVLLSMGDLYMTLIHLTTVGMLEANPVARGIISFGSPLSLVCWKLLTTGVAVGILLHARRRWTAEFAALICCGILTWLTLRWVAYSDQMATMTPEMQAIVRSSPDEPRWVTMVPGS